MDERWERMISMVSEQIRVGKLTAKPPRFLTEEACWKRNVYSFALSNTQSAAETSNLKRFTEALILGNVDRRLPDSPAFEVNPFHWVLSALAADGAWIIDRRYVFRFGRHLLYAKQHRVPEEFLIGFLFQAGTPTEVEKKAGAGTTEIWRDHWIATSQPRD